ncbi:hypothetical protein KEM55_002427 [Ascosphaera atra]|nr:hypothetical protein KEM55_002427 [Ascosphaera atra]
MLGFLNREGLALGSIDGAKIRHWLTERIDGSASGAGDEASAPGDEQPQRAPTSAQTTTTVQTPQASTTQPQAPTTSDVSSTPTPPQPAFTFSAGPEFPTYQPPKDPEDMQLDGSEHPRPLNPNSVFHPDNIPSSFTTSAYPCTSTPNPAPTSTTPNNFLLEVMSPRPSRTNMRSNSGEGMNVGLGSKRKFQFGDFFDISGLGNNGRDGFGPNGGKRGRFT